VLEGNGGGVGTDHGFDAVQGGFVGLNAEPAGSRSRDEIEDVGNGVFEEPLEKLAALIGVEPRQKRAGADSEILGSRRVIFRNLEILLVWRKIFLLRDSSGLSAGVGEIRTRSNVSGFGFCDVLCIHRFLCFRLVDVQWVAPYGHVINVSL